MSGSSYAGKTACEGKKFYVELTGIQHGKEQAIQFYDLTDMTEQEALENKQQVDEKEETSIFSWDWCDETENRNVWLSIPAEDQPIKLPLFEDVTSYNLRSGEQDYMLQAVVPMTLMPTFSQSLKKKEDKVAPVRDGYIYISYNGKFWREIAISSTKKGEPCFNDVNLFNFRSGKDKPFKENTKRKATGIDLKEIWFPEKVNGSSSDVRFAYSEVQWSGSRLNHLEANIDKLEDRMTMFKGQLLNLTELPNMRARQFELEMFLGNPIDYNRDISGVWLSDTYSAIKQNVESIQKDGNAAIQQYQSIPSNDCYRYELTLRQSALFNVLKKSDDTNTWKSEKTVDWLEYAKAHKIHGIILEDLLFDVRNRSYLCKAGVSYLGLVLNDASKQTYFNSAELVQRFLVPKNWGEKENKNHKYIEDRDFDNSYGGRFHRTLRSTERWWCETVVNEVQGFLSQLLESKKLAIHLKDISSLDDANATAIYPFIGNAISSLSLQISKVDYLAVSEKEHGNSSYINSLKKLLSNDRSHPLHQLLFLEDGKVSLEADYIVPKEGINDGSGMCTPESIARWADKKLLIDPADVTVLELNDLLPVLKDNGGGSFGTVRRIANFTDGLFKDFFQAFNEVKKAVGHTTTTAFSMNAYTPALSLLKASGPTALGQMRFVSANKVPSDWYIIGVHGKGLSFGLSEAERKYVTNKKKGTTTGTAFDKKGKLVFSSSKKNVKNAGASVSRKIPIEVVAVPGDSAIAELYTKPSTKRALDDLGKKGTTLSHVYERFKVPYFIVCIELWNLKSNWQYFKNLADFRDTKKFLYSLANVSSVIVDLSVALAHAGNLCLGAESLLYKVTNVVSEYTLLSKMSSLSASIKASVSRLAFVGFVGGLLTAGIAAYDTFTLFRHNDNDAMVGMAMVAIGTLISAFAGIAVSGTLLAAAGPWGFAIAVIGGLLYMWLKDKPIEVWISNGPFANDPSKDYAHLQDPDIAFKRLLNLFLAFNVKMYSTANEVIATEEEAKALIVSSGATHAVLVKSNLSQLLNKDKTQLSMFARQGVMDYIRTRTRTGFGYDENIINIDSYNTPPVEHIELNDGDLFLFKVNKKVPKDKNESSFMFSKYTEHHYQEALVVRARLKVDDIIMPCSELDDPSEPSANKEEKPEFTENEKFWLKSVTTEKFSWSSPIVSA